MLEVGPLVGMIQIPGIKYGVRDVITLATLNSAIEDVLECVEASGIDGLEAQTEFFAQCVSAWLEASGRFERPTSRAKAALSPENVAYQGRVLVSIISLLPAMTWRIKRERLPFVSGRTKDVLTEWLKEIAHRAALLEGEVFLAKAKFRERGFLGSGGIGRFRDSLWAAAIGDQRVKGMPAEKIAQVAEKNHNLVLSQLGFTSARKR